MPTLCRTERREDMLAVEKRWKGTAKRKSYLGIKRRRFRGLAFSIGLRFRRRRMNGIPTYIFFQAGEEFYRFRGLTAVSLHFVQITPGSHIGVHIMLSITILAHLMTLLSSNSSFVSTLCDSRISDTFIEFVLARYNIQSNLSCRQENRTSWRKIYLPSSSLIFK